jgi:hypothetical protein
MRIVAAAALSFLFAASGFAQGQSVWLHELTTDEVRAAVAAGKTTAIYYTSGIHANDAWVVLGKHLVIARHVAQRVAEELGNALVLPINPFTPAVSGGDPNPAKRVGTMRSPGTLTVTDATYSAMSREIVTSAIVTAGFKNVLVMGDHGFGQDTPGRKFPDNFDGGALRKVTEELDAEWKPRGTRVYFIPVDGEVDHRMIPEYLTKQKVPAKIQTPVDDISEVWSIDPKGIREDKIPPEMRAIASPELGGKFVDLKVSTIMRHARSLGLAR